MYLIFNLLLMETDAIAWRWCKSFKNWEETWVIICCCCCIRLDFIKETSVAFNWEWLLNLHAVKGKTSIYYYPQSHLTNEVGKKGLHTNWEPRDPPTGRCRKGSSILQAGLSLLHAFVFDRITWFHLDVCIFLLASTFVENINFDSKPDSSLCQRASFHHVVILWTNLIAIYIVLGTHNLVKVKVSYLSNTVVLGILSKTLQK